MSADLHVYIDTVWIALGVFWAASALAAKRTARTQSARSRLVQAIFPTVGFALLFNTALRLGPLDRRFVPESSAIAYSGLALTVAGAALAIWARLLLGRNWSAVVTIKQDHKLVRRGPYAVVRHPIYTGLLLAMAGTAVAFGEARGLVAVALAFVGWWLKARLEESFMMQQ